MLCWFMSCLEKFVIVSSLPDLTTTLNASTTPSNNSWIIDSGASDHMTGISFLFSSYNIYSSMEKVRIANGSLSLVFGKGSIFVSPSHLLCRCHLFFVYQILQPIYCPLFAFKL